MVLAFDDKRHVPKAKAITQLKRRAGVNILPFSETDVLPHALPTEWKEAIMSPWFKHRVIELVCANVPRLITPPAAGCKLIVDWETVVEYTYGSEEPVARKIETSNDIGEADLKFTRWARLLQCSMLIEATDGDYIPISLGLMAGGFDKPIVILKAWTQERGLEFISIDKLFEFLQRRFRAKNNRPATQWWEVKLFIVLLGLSGTDFTRNLPLVSPIKMWAALPLMVQTFEMEGNRIDAAQGKRMVEILYSEAFPKHIDVFSRRSVWHQAQVLWIFILDAEYFITRFFFTGLQTRHTKQGLNPYGRADHVHIEESQLFAGVLAGVRTPCEYRGVWVSDY